MRTSRSKLRHARWAAIWLATLAPAASGVESELLYLSGKGYGDTVEWDFFCTDGRRSGQWTRIPVPSQWELQGFGHYNYGHDEEKSREEGRYRHRFRLPDTWRGRTVELVFEGVMTDAEVRLNGESAGPVHQGAFYRFRYDVTDLLDWDGENLLEVDVRKRSSNRSVNAAERDADYWVFGGIFRPVYLEATPPERIAHVAVDARHDGTLRLAARLAGLAGPARLTAQVTTLDGTFVGEPFGADAEPGEVELVGSVREPRPWSAEDPSLYLLVVELTVPSGGSRGEVAGRDDDVLHRRTVRFGFRTVEVVPGSGIHVNGHRVVLKGLNRHAFWPDSGRTLSDVLDRGDVSVMKSMGMNAVRASHYPPDESFLDACDELGLYVLDELAGWHDAYDTEVGRRLVAEMVERDVNHPSILFWDNGNEGGWNDDLDAVFGVYDLQGRPVLRPDEPAAGIDTTHYLTWEELTGALDDERPVWERWLTPQAPLVMPTEFLHGLYDGGSGASLEDYWRAITSSPRGAGGFLWAFTDEAVARTDRGGELDTDGNHAPDGILGPYREISGNFYAVRQVFAPVRLAERLLADDFDGTLHVENRYDMTDLADLRFRFSWIVLPRPGATEVTGIASGEVAGPPAPPGARALLRVPSEAFAEAEALRLVAYDPAGRDVRTWVLPRYDRRRMAWGLVEEGQGSVTGGAEDDRFRMRTEQTEVAFDLATGEIAELVRGGRRLSLGGPRPTDGETPQVLVTRHGADGAGYTFEARYKSGLEAARWTLYPSGWLRLSYRYTVRGRRDFFGVLFPYPRDRLKEFEWFGLGPARIWKNRRHGVVWLWRKRPADEAPLAAAHEPKLAGYYGNVYWARLRTTEGTLRMVLGSELDLGVFAAEFPDDARDARAAVPSGGISLLNGISPIGTKFHPPGDLGPQGQPHRPDGLYHGTVWLYLE